MYLFTRGIMAQQRNKTRESEPLTNPCDTGHTANVPSQSVHAKTQVLCAVLGHSVVSDALQPHGLQPTRLLCPWGVGCHAFPKGIFPTQEMNRGLLHCRWILHQLSYLGSPKCRYLHLIHRVAVKSKYYNMDKILITIPGTQTFSKW